MTDRDRAAAARSSRTHATSGSSAPDRSTASSEHAATSPRAIGELRRAGSSTSGAAAGCPAWCWLGEWPDGAGRCCSTRSSAGASSSECGRAPRAGRPGRGRCRAGRDPRPRSESLRAPFDLVVARSFGAPAVTAECAVGFLRAGGPLVVTEPPGIAARSDRALARRRAGPARPRTCGSSSATATRGGGADRSAGPVDDRWPRRDGVPTQAPALVERAADCSTWNSLALEVETFCMFHVEHP